MPRVLSWLLILMMVFRSSPFVVDFVVVVDRDVVDVIDFYVDFVVVPLFLILKLFRCC